MASILIGVGIGAIIATIYNYIKDSHEGLIPTNYMLTIGIIALILGLLMHFNVL